MEKKRLYAAGQPIEPEVNLEDCVKKELGKGLSANDFTDTYQDKLKNVEERAQRNIIHGVKGEAETNYRAGNVDLSKDNIGLGNVENKSSTQIRDEITKGNVAAALGYIPEVHGAYSNATAYTDAKVAELINGAPETMDTLKEVADAIRENETVADALDAAIGTKASRAELDSHTANDTIHIVAPERQKWDRTAQKLENITGTTDNPEEASSTLLPTSKALKQVFQSVSNGKRVIASAITDRGIPTAADAAFQVMADHIGSLSKPAGNAAAEQVLSGFTFSNAAQTGITGAMANRGAVSAVLHAGGAYAIPAGYHNGSGRVTAHSLASQTTAQAAAANLSSGKTAWVNGAKITGSGADNTSHYNSGHSAGVTAADARANPASANYQTGYNAGVTAADARVNPASANYQAGYAAGSQNTKLRRLGIVTMSRSENAAVNGYATKSLFNLSSISGYRNLIFGQNAFAVVAVINSSQGGVNFTTGTLDGDQVNIGSDIPWHQFNNVNYPNNGSDSVLGWRLTRLWYNPATGNLYAMSYQTCAIVKIIIYAT